MSILLAAGIGAALGAGMGAFSTWHEKERQRQALEQQKKSARKAYAHGRELSDRQYAVQKLEAAYRTGVQEKTLREGMGQFENDYNARLLASAFGEQDARIRTASGVGASLAMEGMSGTRGNAANRLARDYASRSLDRQTDLQKRADAGVLSSAVQGANRAAADIRHERASWETGGWRHAMKTAQDDHNKKMSDLGIENLDWQEKQIFAPGNMAIDYTTGIFGGARTGASLGATTGRTWENFFNA